MILCYSSVVFSDDLFRVILSQIISLHVNLTLFYIAFFIIKAFEKMAFYNEIRGNFIRVWWVRSVVLSAFPHAPPPPW